MKSVANLSGIRLSSKPLIQSPLKYIDWGRGLLFISWGFGSVLKSIKYSPNISIFNLLLAFLLHL